MRGLVTVLYLRGVSFMFCEEQNRLLRDLTSAVEEHAQLMERIVIIIRSREPRKGYPSLLRRAALSKGKWQIVQNELHIHCKRHGCQQSIV